MLPKGKYFSDREVGMLQKQQTGKLRKFLKKVLDTRVAAR